MVLNKAAGLSSNSALQEVKKLYEANKAGHAGSLDPLATGVLPVCLGEATKVSQFLLDSDKRTIADDLGQELGCGAHIIKLHRTQAGVFKEADCISSQELALDKASLGLDKIDQHLIPMDQAILDLPEVKLPSSTASYVKNGQSVLVRHVPEEGLVRMYEDEQFIGIGSIDDEGKVAPRRLIVN